MNTELVRADGAGIRRAARIVKEGGLVAFPTETVYGLGANALCADAVLRIFSAKGRPADNPLIVHIARIKQLEELVESVPAAAQRLIDLFWPGPLTLVMKKSALIPGEVTAGLDTVGVRMPAHAAARALILRAGLPLAAPSANRSGRPSPTTAQDVLFDMDGRIPMILDGGPCRVGLESTVLSLTGEVPVVLRPGGVTAEMLREALGEVSVHPSALLPLEEGEAAPSPGMKYRHYAPRARVRVLTGDPDRVRRGLSELYDRALGDGEDPVILAVTEDAAFFGGRRVSLWGSREKPEELAGRLFSALREADAQGRTLILCGGVEIGGIGLAVMNRLCRAAGFEVTEV